MSNTTTTPIIRKEEVNICGSNILAVVTADNQCYFSPRHVCDALGIAWQVQHRKIMEDQVLASSVTEMVMEVRRSDTGNLTSRTYTMLPIEFLSGWLFTIKKVRPELQAKLNLYRAEGFRALDAWFRQGLRNDPVVTESPKYYIPQTLAEALEFAAKQVREKEALEAQNKILAPKAKLYDKYMDANGTLNLTGAAKAFGFTSGQVLGTYLREVLGWLFKDTKKVLPKAHVIEKGYMTTKLWCSADGRKSGVQGRITAKGMDYLMKHFGLNELKGGNE